MKIYLDNIIFSLQKAGGVSVVWSEILSRFLKEQAVDLYLVEYQNSNIFRKNLNIPLNVKLLNKKIFPLFLSRYCDVDIPQQEGLFHSSYYRVATSKKIKNITTVHDFTYEYYRKGLPKSIHSLQKRYAIKKSEGIICVSENTKNDLLYFNPKVEESKVKVIYNGVSEDFFELGERKVELLKNIIHFESESYALYIGDRKSKYKNFLLTVKSCKKTNMPLVIVGGGILLKSEINVLNEILGENNYIHKVGLTNFDLNILFNNAFCLLYPSSYEGFGIPLIEAQRAGCPVISTNLSSIPEVANDSALLIDSISVSTISESIKLLLNLHSIRSTTIQKGLINSARFSWDKCYEETFNFYKKIY